MQDVVGNKATNAQDVRRQTQGEPTLAQEAKRPGDIEPNRPGITEHSPGTVGAAPGANVPSQTDFGRK